MYTGILTDTKVVNRISKYNRTSCFHSAKNTEKIK